MPAYGPRTSIDNSVPRVDSNSRLLQHFQFELRRGPTPNIAHSFVAGSESPSAGVGVRMISSALGERQAAVQCELDVFYSAFHTLCWGSYVTDGTKMFEREIPRSTASVVETLLNAFGCVLPEYSS